MLRVDYQSVMDSTTADRLRGMLDCGDLPESVIKSYVRWKVLADRGEQQNVAPRDEDLATICLLSQVGVDKLEMRELSDHLVIDESTRIEIELSEPKSKPGDPTLREMGITINFLEPLYAAGCYYKSQLREYAVKPVLGMGDMSWKIVGDEVAKYEERIAKLAESEKRERTIDVDEAMAIDEDLAARERALLEREAELKRREEELSKVDPPEDDPPKDENPNPEPPVPKEEKTEPSKTQAPKPSPVSNEVPEVAGATGPQTKPRSGRDRRKTSKPQPGGN